MIKKIKKIKNFGIFKDFVWDDIKEFSRYNLIYGWNYSGKTTLSRIIRSLETKNVYSKIENPDFEIILDDDSIIKHNNLNDHNKNIRVFNSDYIKDNLSFLNNENNGKIESFAIFGETNIENEKEIKKINNVLGINEEGNETGLYKDQKNKEEEYKTVNNDLTQKEKQLNEKLKEEATNGKNSNLYGDQNYNISKIKNDIKIVLKSEKNYALTEEEIEKLKNIIKEEKKDPINIKISNEYLNIEKIFEESKVLCEKQISKTNKIQNLFENVLLNKWVKEGMEYHNKNDKCIFCDNEIKKNRWKELENHFDEESKKLDNYIDELLKKILKEKNILDNSLKLKKEEFYIEFQSDYEKYKQEFNEFKDKYKEDLIKIEGNLQEKKENIEKINKIIKNINDLIEKSNEYTNELKSKQEESQKTLKYNRIYNLIKNIDFKENNEKIDKLKEKIGNTEKGNESGLFREKINIENKIIELQNKRKGLEESEHDEKNAVIEINKLLKMFIRHDTIEFGIRKSEEKQIYFEIFRGNPTDENKAYNLSEGEKNLIAFCHFITKLEDNNTKNKDLIIWIDDPISSLDSNHIFDIYSLIYNKFFKKIMQLFISTHNFEFFNLINDLFKREIRKEKENKVSMYHVKRLIGENISIIEKIPDVLNKFNSEYVYLFNLIIDFTESQINEDKNIYETIYFISNIIRRFLENYLGMRKPDGKSWKSKLIFLFEDGIEREKVRKLIDVKSHNQSINTFKNFPDMSECKNVINLIIESLKNNDEIHYNALIENINNN